MRALLELAKCHSEVSQGTEEDYLFRCDKMLLNSSLSCGEQIWLGQYGGECTYQQRLVGRREI